MSLEQITKYIIILAGIALGLFLLPFLLKLLAPFLAAFFIAALCQSLIRFMQRRLGISRGISSALLVTFIVAAIISLIFWTVLQLLGQAKNLIVSLPETIHSFRIQLSALTQKYEGFMGSLPPEISSFIDMLTEQLQSYSSELSGKVTSAALDIAKNFAAALPSIFIFIVMLILGTFFFTKDYLLVINFFKELLPESIMNFLTAAKNSVIKAFSSYLKAQLLLMLLTSFLVTVGLWVVGKDYALLWGLVCGLVDALPVLGTAVILIPWSLVSLIYGDMYSFISILIIQALVFVVRQLAEPKIISHQIGIHPILTLVSVYLGLKFFGIPGVIFAPILTLLAVNFYVSHKENADG